MSRVGVVVTAAGSGERLGADRPKALVTVGGASLLQYALERALSVADELVVTAPESHLAEAREIASAVVVAAEAHDGRSLTGTATPRVQSITVVPGGVTRQDSVRAGIEVLADVDLVLVHDAARAFAPAEIFHDVLRALEGGAVAVIPALPVIDTIKRADSQMRVTGTVDRSELWAVQTPQGFRRDALARAHASGEGTAATDDAALVEALGETVQLVPGHEDAFKVTVPRDLALAEAMMAHRNGNTC